MSGSSSELAYLAWHEAAARIKRGELSSELYTQTLLERIATLDPSLNAFIQVDAEGAIASAKEADRQQQTGATLGPLHGVPYGLKDIIDHRGLPTTAHSRILLDNHPDEDAEVAQRLRKAGGVLLGKLSTHEFAIGGPAFDLPFPPARNPWNRDYGPGGSSSGSGSAVAAGMLPLALGTDTAGSVRNPCTACALVGIKPTYGRVSRRGVFPLSFSLDHIGPLTRSVEENAHALELLAGHDPRDPGSANDRPTGFATELKRGVVGLKVGAIRHFDRNDMQAHPAVTASIDAALAVFASLGADVEEVTTRPLQEFVDCNRTILTSEAYAIHEHWLRTRPQDYSAMSRERMLPGAFLRAVDYVQATRRRMELRADIERLLQDYDVLICASSMEPAYRIDDPEEVARCYPRQARTPFNLTGHPALAFPSGFSDGQMPLGIQAVGRNFDEATLYKVAYAHEQATSWKDARPPLPGGA